MSYQVNDKERDSVFLLPLDNRYGYLIKKIIDWDECWSIGDENSWVLYGTPENVELVPVWPASAFALACCTGAWSDKRPKVIPLSEWIKEWLPGMAKDKRRVAVFPNPQDQGAVVEPSKMLNDIKAHALEWYE